MGSARSLTSDGSLGRTEGPAGPEASERGAARPSGLDAAFVAVARIAKPQGRRGELLAEILTDFPARFESRRRVFLEGPGAPSPVEVENVWMHKGRIVFKFQGVDSIGQAECLRGRHILIPQEERAPLPPHHYYWWELRGCRVVREAVGQREDLGTVEDVERTPGGELLHVATRRGEVLIPLAQAICTRIDPAAKLIVVDPPDDLLGLNS